MEHTTGPDREFLRPEGAERWLWLSLPEISLEVLTASGSNKAAAAPASWLCQPVSQAVTEAEKPASTLRTEPFPGSRLLTWRRYPVGGITSPLPGLLFTPSPAPLEFVERSGGTPLTSSD